MLQSVRASTELVNALSNGFESRCSIAHEGPLINAFSTELEPRYRR